MLRLIFIFLAGLVLCAQTPIPGFPPGTFQSRAAIDAGGAAAYVGPLDVAGYTSSYAYYGFRCSKSAYIGNVALIKNVATPATTTQLTCSSGGVLNQTLNTLATTCATACAVVNVTDQVGSGGDMQGGNVPSFVNGGLGGTALGMSGDGGISNQFLVTVGNSTALAQPITLSAIVSFTSGVSGGEVWSEGAFNFQPFASLTSTTVSQDAGTRVDYTMSHAIMHSGHSVINGASSSFKIDGAAPVSSGTSGAAAITGASKTQLFSGSAGGSVFFNGTFIELIIVGAAVSPTNQGLQATNQCAYFGTVC